MKTSEVLQAWGRILRGQFPILSIEITRECPLRCSGCYAYEDGHLGGSVNLRQLADLRGKVWGNSFQTRLVQWNERLDRLKFAVLGLTDTNGHFKTSNEKPE